MRNIASHEHLLEQSIARIAFQMLGDLCGFGITYFDFDSTGYVKTPTFA